MTKLKSIKAERLFVLDKDTKFLIKALGKSKTDLTITHKTEFDEFINSKYQVNNIVILVELNWEAPLSNFYGYEVAKQLMNSSNRESSFNLLFLSTLKRETIYRLNSGKNNVFTKRFPHEQINESFDATSLKIPEFSDRKFDYLKNYCLLESGIIDRIEHDVRNLLANADPAKLQKVIREIEANRSIFTPQILATTEMIAGKKDPVEVKKDLNELHRLLQQLQVEINNPEESQKKKSHSVVMLIEDESETLEKLRHQLGEYFHSIKPFEKGTEAFHELKRNAHEYDVVITDMELLNGDFDDQILGIDILELCERDYPFLVTRVITSLPKNALKRLLGKSLDEIIFKGVTAKSVIPPFENLSEFVQQVDQEVKKRRALRSMAGPEISWWGKHLTKQLYLTKINNPDRFNEIWRKAKGNAERFISGEFDHLNNEEKLPVEFKQVQDTVSNPESGWDIIERLLSHRLIALWFASKHSWGEFYFEGTDNESYVKQKGFQEGLESKNPKNYFNTFLGLSFQYYPVTDGVSKCKIVRKNLFAEEINWLGKNNVNILKEISLQELDYNISSFFIEFFNGHQVDSLSEESTFGEALEVMEDFIQKYPYEPFDRVKHNYLKEIFEWDAEDIYPQLPEIAQNYIDTIREEIFPV